MTVSGVFLCLAVGLGQAENLLANASFEEIAPDGRPAHWSAFVMPQDGAFAEADPLALEGSHSAMLHVPNRYDREPANNWSQVVLAQAGGKDLVFTGMIRTEAAGEAALWLQCFTRAPARVAAAASSSAQAPITGTVDWTRAEVRVAAPPNTEFIVARCVLKGQGTAWFDDLRVEIAQAETPLLSAIEPAAEPVEAAPVSESLGDADLIEVSRMLHEAIAELEQTNSKILERVQRIQAEFEQTRGAAPEIAPLETRHPLVPHGWTPKEHPDDAR